MNDKELFIKTIETGLKQDKRNYVELTYVNDTSCEYVKINLNGKTIVSDITACSNMAIFEIISNDINLLRQ